MEILLSPSEVRLVQASETQREKRLVRGRWNAKNSYDMHCGHQRNWTIDILSTVSQAGSYKPSFWTRLLVVQYFLALALEKARTYNPPVNQSTWL